MPAPPRLTFPGTAVLITTRTEEGLPFTAAEYMNLSVWSFLAKAQNLFPIKICHMVSMSNHPHLVVYIENPEDVSAFMNLYKTDMAHIFNRLRGRKKRTVWCKGFTPDAWMEAFGITDDAEKKAINRRIIARVRELEAEYDQQRIKDGTPVLGRDQIIDQPIDKPYIPKKFSKRQWCICRDIEKRVAYICFVKRLILAGKAVWQRWKIGDYSIPYPLGLFAPRLRRRGNLVPGYLD